MGESETVAVTSTQPSISTTTELLGDDRADVSPSTAAEVAAADLSPFCSELDAIVQEVSQASSDAGSDPLLMLVVVAGATANLDSYLERLGDAAPDGVAASLERVRNAFNLNDLTNARSATALAAQLTLIGFEIDDDLTAIDDFAVQECGTEFLGDLFESAEPTSPRPTEDGSGILIDGRSIYDESMCSDIEPVADEPFHEDTLVLYCVEAGSRRLLAFSTEDWALLSDIALPPAKEDQLVVSAGGPTVAALRYFVIPASGLEPGGPAFELLLFARSQDGLEPVDVIELPAIQDHIPSNGDPSLSGWDSNDPIFGVTSSGTVALSTFGPDPSNWILSPAGELIFNEPYTPYEDFEETIYDTQGSATRDFNRVVGNFITRNGMSPILDASGGLVALDGTPNFLNADIEVCGSTLSILSGQLVDIDGAANYGTIAYVADGQTGKVAERAVLNAEPAVSSGVVVGWRSSFDGAELRGFSTDGELWSREFPSYFLDGVRAIEGRVFATNEQGEHIEIDAVTGEQLAVGAELPDRDTFGEYPDWPAFYGTWIVERPSDSALSSGDAELVFRENGWRSACDPATAEG